VFLVKPESSFLTPKEDLHWGKVLENLSMCFLIDIKNLWYGFHIH